MTKREIIIVLTAAKKWMRAGEFAAFACDVSEALYGDSGRRSGDVQAEHDDYWREVNRQRNERRRA